MKRIKPDIIHGELRGDMPPARRNSFRSVSSTISHGTGHVYTCVYLDAGVYRLQFFVTYRRGDRLYQKEYIFNAIDELNIGLIE